ncbi:hypothetical protein SMC26_37765 [Actinomadura fulvescens]
MGLSSNAMYGMGLASVGASMMSWFISRHAESAGIDRADRWGIFVGQWAPTFFAMGIAMRLEEQEEHHDAQHLRAAREHTRTAMPVG